MPDLAKPMNIPDRWGESWFIPLYPFFKQINS